MKDGKKIHHSGEAAYEEVIHILLLAEEEDINDETDSKWCRPRVKNIVTIGRKASLHTSSTTR